MWVVLTLLVTLFSLGKANRSTISELEAKRRSLYLFFKVVTYRRNRAKLVVQRSSVFESARRYMINIPGPRKIYITFEGEPAMGLSGPLREFFSLLSTEFVQKGILVESDGWVNLNPTAYDKNRDEVNYYFLGKAMGMAVLNNAVLNLDFSPSFYQALYGETMGVEDLKPTDSNSLKYLLQTPASEWGSELRFCSDDGKTDLKPNGCNIVVNDSNKQEYVQLYSQFKQKGTPEKMNMVKKGLFAILPESYLHTFTLSEIPFVFEGKKTIDITDWKAHTVYKKSDRSEPVIQWFWRLVESMSEKDRQKLLQFVTGSPRVPLGGFAALKGIHGSNLFTIRVLPTSDRLPVAHTCFNYLDLPRYSSSAELREKTHWDRYSRPLNVHSLGLNNVSWDAEDEIRQ